MKTLILYLHLLIHNKTTQPQRQTDGNKMRTVRTKVYKFNELTEDAKQKAIQHRREHFDNSYIYEDARATVNAFNEIFNTQTSNRSFLEVRTGHMEDDILNLSGLRARTYLYNNYFTELYQGKYYNVKANHPLKHRRVKSTTYKNGNTHNAYRSAITLENSCVLTGMCYDENMLEPLYKFMEKYDHKQDQHTTLEDLFTECFETLRITLEREEEYLNSDAHITEELEQYESEFLATGHYFNF